MQFKQRVIDVFKRCWYNGITNSRSLLMYKNFKQTYEFEHYLNILPSKLRIPLSRLRLSAHQLRKYIRPYYYQRSSIHKFIMLMQNTQRSSLNNLGKYVYEAFALRRTLLTS